MSQVLGACTSLHPTRPETLLHGSLAEAPDTPLEFSNLRVPH
jgi:hypothetical protein